MALMTLTKDWLGKLQTTCHGCYLPWYNSFLVKYSTTEWICSSFSWKRSTSLYMWTIYESRRKSKLKFLPPEGRMLVKLPSISRSQKCSGTESPWNLGCCLFNTAASRKESRPPNHQCCQFNFGWEEMSSKIVVRSLWGSGRFFTMLSMTQSSWSKF